jgi:hypothetical protein
MSDPGREMTLEEIRKREKMMADRMAAYHRSMDEFASGGNPIDQEDANRAMNVWHRLNDEVTELKKYLTDLE